jgi:hypothetical protein
MSSRRIDTKHAKAESLNSNDNAQQRSGDQIASELSDGLESCRAVIADYRAKFAGNLVAANSNDENERDRLTSD